MNGPVPDLMIRWLLTGLVVALSGIANAQSAVEWRGSVSLSPVYLNTTDATGGTVSETVWYGSARLFAEWYPVSWLELVAEPRVSILYTNNPSLVEGLVDPGGTGSTFLSAGWKQSTKTGNRELRLNRWTATIRTGSVDIVTGRQRVNWGTNLIWNPLDIFNPRQSFSLDASDLPSADAVSVSWFPDETSQVNVAVKPGRNKFQQTAGVLVKTNWSETDFLVIAGWSQEIPTAGFGLAGEILDGGFRGEILWRQHYWMYQADSPLPGKSESAEMLAALSGDYTFENSLYLHAEMLWQSAGTTGKAAAGYAESVLNNRQSPARWAFAGDVGYTFHPLVRGQLIVLLNPSDRSSLTGPSISVSILNNLDGSIQLLHGSGETGTEFSGLGTIGNLRLVWSF